MFPFTTVILYAIALQLVHALPLTKRIVISPLITSPKADTVWTPGSSQLVTWYASLRFCGSATACTRFAHLNPRDTSVVPPNGTFSGMLVLGRQTPGSENLDLGKFQADPSSLVMYLISPPLLLKIIPLQLVSLFGVVRFVSPARQSHPGTIT